MKSEDTIIASRSIGSGPACFLASKRKVGALILISPFTSLRDVVKSMVWSIFSYVIKERFKNIERMEKVNCPTLFIHGKKDNLIPYKHALELIKKCKNVTIHFGD